MTKSEPKERETLPRGSRPPNPKRPGDLLKAERLSHGKSLEEVAQATKIRTHLIQAIESNQWKAFPAEVYLLGFLGRYAQYLGLDPQAILQIYHQEKISFQEGDRSASSALSEQARKTTPPASDVLKHPVAIGLLSIFIVSALVFALLQHHRSSPQPAKGGEETSAQMGLPTSSLSAPPVKKVPGKKPPAHLLSVKASRPTWLSVSSGGRRVFEGILPPDTPRVWASGEPFTIRVNKVYALAVEHNGKAVDLTGLEGREARLPLGEAPEVPPGGETP